MRGIFIFAVQNNTLIHIQTIQLAENPLDLAIVRAEGHSLKLAVSVDAVPDTVDDRVDSSLLTLDVDGSGKVSAPNTLLPIVETADEDVTRDELDKILYAVENLRKTEFEDADEDEQPPKGPVISQGEGGADVMDVGETA